MSRAKEFEERYQRGDLPWDTGERDDNLEEAIREYSINPCPVLELGAGTGTNAIWLAKKGFDVTAVDVSPTAVEMASRKASDKGINIKFITADILKDNFTDDHFDFVYDRGCFHTFDLPWERSRLAEIIWNHLNPGGYWFSIMGSTDGPPRDEGPPRRSALDIASAVEPKFEIIQLRSIHMRTNLPESPRGWACLMRKREIPEVRPRK